MLTRLSKLRAKRAAGENGFTLIELLVVVVILGILIAIAIPLYLNYRKGANDASAKSDLRNAVNAFEQCNTDGGAYPLTVAAGGAITGCGSVTSVNVSSGTTFPAYYLSSTAPKDYIITATNSNGSGKVYCYSSAAGGSVKTTAGSVSGYLATCPA